MVWRCREFFFSNIFGFNFFSTRFFWNFISGGHVCILRKKMLCPKDRRPLLGGASCVSLLVQFLNVKSWKPFVEFVSLVNLRFRSILLFSLAVSCSSKGFFGFLNREIDFSIKNSILRPKKKCKFS